MQRTRLQILSSFGIVQRKGKCVHAQLLAGNIEEDAEPIEFVSEAAGDRWRVSSLSMFVDPPSPKRKEVWDRGERALWFVPIDEMRNLIDGEVFCGLPVTE